MTFWLQLVFSALLDAYHAKGTEFIPLVRVSGIALLKSIKFPQVKYH